MTERRTRALRRWSIPAVGLLLWACTAVQADVPETISRVKPSVVIVGTFNATSSPRFSLRGSGFVVGDGNLAITNAHVIPDGAQVEVDSKLVVQVRVETKGSAGQSELLMRQASVIEVDKLHDLALLQFDGAPVPKLTLRDSDTVREGQSIAFTGFPIGGALGFSAVTHRGIVSSITPIALPSASAQQLNARNIASLRSGSFNIFQLDATAYPGNSGGPMFDAETGEVLGVINMVFVKGTKESALTNPTGISYAIPSKYVFQLLHRQKTE